MKPNTSTNPSKKKTKATAAKKAALDAAVTPKPAPAPVAPTAPAPVPAPAAISHPAAPATPVAPKAPVVAPAAAPAKLTAAPTTPKVNLAAPQSAASVAPVETPTPVSAPSLVRVNFTFHAPDATRVTLAGDFNNWSTDGLALKRQGEGLWQASLPLKPGRYQYKFIVDGAWAHDPKATESRANEFGTLNSVVVVRA